VSEQGWRDQIATWPVPRFAVGVTNTTSTIAELGDPLWVTQLASISKLFAGFVALIAIEEGSLDLDEHAGPPGATVRHLLSHAAGYGFNRGDLGNEPGERRTYSNVGIEVFAEVLAERSGLTFEDYLRFGVLEPLGLMDTSLSGSPAHGMSSTVADLLVFARELMAPTLVSPETLEMARLPQFPALDGVLPGFGSQKPNPWGLAFEVRGEKSPHWTAPEHSPQTFGHFGGAGTFLWVDPVAELACVCLTNRDFGPWAVPLWAPFNAAVLQEHGL